MRGGGTDSQARNHHWGMSVALSHDGRAGAAGAPQGFSGCESRIGGAHAYPGPSVSKIGGLGDVAGAGKGLGSSVALSAVGSPRALVTLLLLYASSASAAWPYDKRWVEMAGTDAMNRNWMNIAISSDGSKRAAAGNADYLYESSDYGASWTQVTSTVANWKGVAMSSDGTVQAAWSSGPSSADMKGLFTSADTGATWTHREMPAWLHVSSYTGTIMHCAVSPDGTHMTALASGPPAGPMFISSDAGVTWTTSGPSKYWRKSAMSADGSIQTATTGHLGARSDLVGTMYRSSDSGATWTEVAGMTAHWGGETSMGTGGVAMSSDGVKQVAATHEDNLWYSSDSGVTWTEVTGLGLDNGYVNGATGYTPQWSDVSTSSDGSRMVASGYLRNTWFSTDSGTPPLCSHPSPLPPLCSRPRQLPTSAMTPRLRPPPVPRP